MLATQDTVVQNGTPIAVWVLSDNEKSVLYETWSSDFEFLYELGAKIYAYIFETNPKIMKLFPLILQHGKNWRNSDDFRTQALRLVKTLSMCLDNLDYTNRIVDNLYEIGVNHVQFANRGFQPDHWDIYHRALDTVLSNHVLTFKDLSPDRKKLALETWAKLAAFIINHMKKGFYDKLLLQYSAVVNEANEAKEETEADDEDEEKKKGFFSRILSAITTPNEKKEDGSFEKEKSSAGSEKENTERRTSLKERLDKDSQHRKSIERNDKNRLSTEKSKDRSPSPKPEEVKQNIVTKTLCGKKDDKKVEKKEEKAKKVEPERSSVIKSDYVAERLEKLDLKEVKEMKLPIEPERVSNHRVAPATDTNTRSKSMSEKTKTMTEKEAKPLQNGSKVTKTETNGTKASNSYGKTQEAKKDTLNTNQIKKSASVKH